ncbi:cytochrome P450 [Streptomyces sp. CG1]|uniref:cytochrome P450 n=1 Tax=Streptomyces sp. CG1 TaxID=1287523 RepID=UPI0034E1DBDF
MAVIQECRRRECPLTWVLRRCAADAGLCGERLCRGDLVCVNLASADGASDGWERAYRFDLHRQAQPHLAMGTGPRICPGRHLAALEARELLDALVARRPRPRPGHRRRDRPRLPLTEAADRAVVTRTLRTGPRGA